jgi:hypothetical protein
VMCSSLSRFEFFSYLQYQLIALVTHHGRNASGGYCLHALLL